MWRSLTLTWPPVHLSSESERTLARRHFKSEQKCLTGSFPSIHKLRGCVLQNRLREAKFAGEYAVRPAIASQDEGDHVTTAETSTRLRSRASSAVWGSPAGIEPQHATRLSNNSNWIPSEGQVYTTLPKKPNEVITPWIRLQNQKEAETAAA